MRETPPGLLRAGRCCRCRSVAVGPAAARPDQAEGLAAFVIEEVGVDRRGEARIVELDREVIAALAGALRPRGTDLCAADKDPVAWSVVAGPIGLRNDADAFGLDAEGDDLTLELVACLLEGTDGCHFASPWLFEPATIAASMAIVSRRRSTTHAQGRSTAEDGGGETPAFAGACFLGSRGMGAAGVPALAGWQAQGKKVSPPPLRQGDRGFAVLRRDHAIKRQRGSRARQPCKEKTGQTWSAQEVRLDGRRNRNPGVRKGGRSHPGSAPRSHCRHRVLSAADSGA